MKTITISLSDGSADETVHAEYFQIEDGWATFKTADHKAVVAYPEARVTRIKSEEKGPAVEFNVHPAGSAEDVKAAATQSAKTAAPHILNRNDEDDQFYEEGRL